MCECLECANYSACSPTKRLSELNGLICDDFDEDVLSFDSNLDGDSWKEMSWNRLVDNILDTEDVDDIYDIYDELF